MLAMRVGGGCCGAAACLSLAALERCAPPAAAAAAGALRRRGRPREGRWGAAAQRLTRRGLQQSRRCSSAATPPKPDGGQQQEQQQQQQQQEQQQQQQQPGAGAESGEGEAAPPRVRPEAEELKERLQKLRDVQRRFDLDSPMEVQMRLGKGGKTTDDLAPRYRVDAPATVQRNKFKEEIARLEAIPDVKILRGAGGQVRLIDVPLEAMNKAEIDHSQRVLFRVKAGMGIIIFVGTAIGIAFVYMVWALLGHDAGPPPNEPIGAKVFLDVFQEDERIGTVVIGLYTKRCPMTCENFYRLCTADNPEGHTYRGCNFFQVFPHVGVVSGDYVKNNGSAGRPVLPYFPGKRWFPDEMAGRDLPFFKGAVCNFGPMLSQKEGHNDSTFLIAKAGTPKHNHSFVIFGEVMAGQSVIDHISQVRVTGGTPVRRVWIKRCGRYTHTPKEREKVETPGPAQFRPEGRR
eukprot:TRINITY_DN29224_c0_g1_i1.p2 TRINITY_DN29224_c0_g1~~TRINITY_DN29224_c0_g1_i1.p2  ORF type:complete len:486 (+),score=181.72 TRINITY_DN29224_c0_g1_i1:79-1458(+)